MGACFEPHSMPSALRAVDADGLEFIRRGKTNTVNKTRVNKTRVTKIGTNSTTKRGTAERENSTLEGFVIVACCFALNYCAGDVLLT